MEDFRRRFPGYHSAHEQGTAASRASHAARQQEHQRSWAAVRASLEYLRDVLPSLVRDAQDRAVAAEIPRKFGRTHVLAGWVFGSYYYDPGNGDYGRTSGGTVHYAIAEDGRIVGGQLVQRGQMSGLVVTPFMARVGTVTKLLGRIGSREHFGDTGLYLSLGNTEVIKASLAKK